MDVACFCGCRYSSAADFGACPACGEYITLRHVSEADARQMRAELDLLVSTGVNPAAVPPQHRGSVETPATRMRKKRS